MVGFLTSWVCTSLNDAVSMCWAGDFLVFRLSYPGHRTHFLTVLSMLLLGIRKATAFKRRKKKKTPITNSGNLTSLRICCQTVPLSVSDILKFSLLRIGYLIGWPRPISWILDNVCFAPPWHTGYILFLSLTSCTWRSDPRSSGTDLTYIPTDQRLTFSKSFREEAVQGWWQGRLFLDSGSHQINLIEK